MQGIDSEPAHVIPRASRCSILPAGVESAAMGGRTSGLPLCGQRGLPRGQDFLLDRASYAIRSLYLADSPECYSGGPLRR